MVILRKTNDLLLFLDFQFIRSTMEKLASTQDDVIPKNILGKFFYQVKNSTIFRILKKVKSQNY